MTKLTREEKIEIYKKRKKGKTIKEITKEYKIQESNVRHIVKLIEKQGIEVLRKYKNNYYSRGLKREIINKVLIEKQSITSTSLEYGLTSVGMLCNWIKSYKENGYDIVEKTRGRPTMKVKKNKKYEEMTTEEKIKYLENKNLYLEAENEYLKKLRAVVQIRENQQKKKK